MKLYATVRNIPVGTASGNSHTDVFVGGMQDYVGHEFCVVPVLDARAIPVPDWYNIDGDSSYDFHVSWLDNFHFKDE